MLVSNLNELVHDAGLEANEFIKEMKRWVSGEVRIVEENFGVCSIATDRKLGLTDYRQIGPEHFEVLLKPFPQ